MWPFQAGRRAYPRETFVFVLSCDFKRTGRDKTDSIAYFSDLADLRIFLFNAICMFIFDFHFIIPRDSRSHWYFCIVKIPSLILKNFDTRITRVKKNKLFRRNTHFSALLSAWPLVRHSLPLYIFTFDFYFIVLRKKLASLNFLLWS